MALLLNDFIAAAKIRRDGYGNLPVYIVSKLDYLETPASYVDVGKIHRYDLEKKTFVAETVIFIG